MLGGNFGVWGGLFSTFDCAVKGIRKKEDPYNASMSTKEMYRRLRGGAARKAEGVYIKEGQG